MESIAKYKGTGRIRSVPLLKLQALILTVGCVLACIQIMPGHYCVIYSVASVLEQLGFILSTTSLQ